MHTMPRQDENKIAIKTDKSFCVSIGIGEISTGSKTITAIYSDSK
jgi:hypothetical protein